MSVEFLSGDGPESRPTRPPPRRGRVVAALATVLLAGAVAVVVLQPEDDTGPTPTPTTASLRPSPVPVLPRPSPVADPCRRVPRCVVDATVPVPLRQLARSYLPPGVRLVVRTVRSIDPGTGRTDLVTRDVEALVDSVRIVVRVQHGGPTTREIVPDPPGVGSLLLHTRNAGFTVRLQYLAPSTVPPPSDRLRAFMADRRLTSS
ncbi:hypothetical protein [Jatrophihabitans fulvus]